MPKASKTAAHRQRTGNDPGLYQRVFDTPDGQKVLIDLQARFYDRKIFVPGGHEGARATDFNCGRMEVVRFILSSTYPHDEPPQGENS
jgi:hypothetical protein